MEGSALIARKVYFEFEFHNFFFELLTVIKGCSAFVLFHQKKVHKQIRRVLFILSENIILFSRYSILLIIILLLFSLKVEHKLANTHF